MERKIFRSILILSLLAALSFLLTAVVAAQASELWPFSSDPGYQPRPGRVETGASAADQAAYQGQASPAAAAAYPSGEGSGLLKTGNPGGLWPDENGYSGPEWVGEGVDAPSGEKAEPLEPWETMLEEPQADDRRSIKPDGTSAWSDFYYFFAAGSTLRPRDMMQGWSASGDGGCIFANAIPGQVMNLHLDLPQGSRIDYLRLFFYDGSSASDSNAWVTMYDGAGNMDDLVFVSSTGSGGYGTTLSGLVEHVVDNYNHAYVLNWRPNVVGSTMRLCGLRVAYRLPEP